MVVVTGAKAGQLRPLFVRDKVAIVTIHFLWASPPVLLAWFARLSTTLCLPQQDLQTARAQTAAVAAHETRLLREYPHAMFCVIFKQAIEQLPSKKQAL